MKTYFLIILLLILAPVASFADNSCFDANGNYIQNCQYDDSFSCTSCSKIKDFSTRCVFPSSAFISKAIKRQVTEKLFREQRCQRVNVTVKVEQTQGSQFVTSGAGNVSLSSVNNPFEVRVNSVNTDCQVQVPVTISVKATGFNGDYIRQTYQSNPVIRGYLR